MDANTSSSEWRDAVKAIKYAILQSQYRAAKGVNREQLSLYFGIGRYVSEHSRKGFWGTGAIDRISEQLQKELPGLRGFSGTSIKKMRQFYEEWSETFRPPTAVNMAEPEIRPPVAGEMQVVQNRPLAVGNLPMQPNRQPIVADTEKIDYLELLCVNRYPSAIDLYFEEFMSVSFTHHMEILAKARTLEERLFYIHQTCINQWDKYKLRDMLKADLYHHQGVMPSNFTKTMPTMRTALQAIEMFKDEYLLDFINVEELGERDKADIDEREVEKAIVHSVKNFIMTFGRDFTFVGNQYHLEKYGHDSYPDLLFYNRELAALVVVELKRGEFKPSYLGQLSAYLRILDSEVKKPFENPSIGIILCKQADKSYVEFLIQGYDNPMGVATYKTAEDVRKVLPSEEELRRVMDEDN
ncbi:MAG: DUF1016 family protein [Prevotella sp.]|nr:DUF1016 family protein [Prevotella sp.]